MKTHNEFVDDEGVAWEFSYDDKTEQALHPVTGEGLTGEDGLPVEAHRVSDFRYRRVGDPEWLSLPPWASVRDDWKITLGLFDEDDATEEMTFYEVVA